MEESKNTIRQRADEVKDYQCKNLIAVLENPMDMKNIGAVIRNANALGVEKIYVVDGRKSLPEDWQEMRERKSLYKISVSASKWTFIKRFDTSEECLAHLEKKRFTSIVTSPHVKGRQNFVLHEADYTQTRLAVWFGNESRGISDLVVERSECCISIPMFGIIESLNLATTSGIVLYEITKQRREYQAKYKRANRGAKTIPTVGS
ncbi:RNA methyltransferase [Paraglaciecola sp. 25GB23A]|uniref:TrmH family RNA methyltransferase n=1 Tax=Paraglaciecola sp. 25GB23A TaxID=3156068 RepID=UPI0032AFB099